MARIRTIKPEFWTSEQVMECSTTARLLFIGLWTFCDDAGIHTYAPRTIKAQVFPADDITAEQVLELLGELERNGLIETYEVAGRQYLQVTGWHHQRIDKPTYRHPKPENSDNDPIGREEGSESDTRGLSEGSATECSGVDLIGDKQPPISPIGEIPPPSESETGVDLLSDKPQPLANPKPKPDPKGSRLPDGWVLPAAWWKWAMEDAAAQGVRVTAEEVRRTAEKFADYWRSKGGKEARKTDWQATWRNWWRRDIDDRKNALSRSTSNDQRSSNIAKLLGNDEPAGFTLEGDARRVG